MKRLKYILICSLLVTLGGCLQDADNLLDKEDLDDIYHEDVFNNAEHANWFLTSLYKDMPQGFFVFSEAGFLGNAVDEGNPKANWDNAYRMGLGDWGPTRMPLNENPWNKYYGAIRAANLFLENADNIPDSGEPFVDENVRQRMKGEATFLRALYYAELIKYYGGVPIIDRALIPTDEGELFKERANYDELVDFIVSEAQKAAEMLPHEYSSSSEFGRATKGAAWALISRVRLHAASSLFNDPSQQESPWAGAYDPQKWEIAAEAARDFILNTNNQYSLHMSSSHSSMGHYEDLFNRRYSPEIIFHYQYEPMERGGDFMHVERVSLPGHFFGYGHGVINNLPVLNLVADYEVVDVDLLGNTTGSHYLGIDRLLEIYESGEVDPETGFDPQNPYANRDPRFYQSIWYQGVNWPARANESFQVWVDEDDPSFTAESYLDGWYNTGFFHRKFVNPYMDMTGFNSFGNQTRTWPIFRYAEILLNYAEAVNEAFGNPDVAPAGYPMSAREAINEIRDRAVYPPLDVPRVIPPGMPVNAMGQSLPPLPTGLSQDQMRQRIRNERRIELSWEEHRYFDVRRWQIAEDVTQDIYSQLVYLKSGATSYEDIRYDVERLIRRPWHDKYNLFPIMEIELRKNPDLKQNPGW
ncbi:MAG: RagB/SusD family nutrient uptake outer membrane protein [Balneolales bacterium]